MSTEEHPHGHVPAGLTTDPGVHLKRALGLGGLTVFGLVYLVPLTIFTTYGIVTEITGGRVALAYVFTLLAMVFTALSYGRMVVAYPVSGSAYTYTQKSFGPHFGFLAGWSLMLDYLFLPMINYLVIGIFLNAQFEAVPVWVWSSTAIVLATVVNIIGIKSIARANIAIIAAQTVFIVVFVVLAVKTAFGETVDLAAPFTGDGSVAGMSPVFAGSAILALSFLGFDAVSTMAEEARNARRDIPKAILLVTLGGGLLFIGLSWLTQVVYPPTTFEDVDSAALDVMVHIGGSAMSSFFLAAYVAGAFGSGITSQASVTRIMYSMGRDGVLPRVFSALSRRWQTPAFAIVFVSVLSFGVVFVDLGTIASMISFGALVAFSAVNLSVMKHYWFDRRERSRSTVLRNLLLPLVGFLMTVWLWTSLSRTALTIGLIWLVVGLVYLAFLTRGFRRRPPELEFAD